MTATPLTAPTHGRRPRSRGGWTPAKVEYLGHVQQVIGDLREHWPLTLRQAFYRLVAGEVIANAVNEYKKLSRTLSQARLDGLVPWAAMEDRARSMLPSAGWADGDTFVDDEVDGFLAGYRRDLMASQPVALELWVEKDALSRLCHRVAVNYCVPVVVARGFSSVSYVNECRNRVEANATRGKRTIVVYAGDLDPSGWEMLPSMMHTLQVEMGLGDMVVAHRAALTPEQVAEHDLPHSPDALKWTDSRAGKYVERFGEIAVELDALPPDVLQTVVREAIEAPLDVSKLADERRREAEDRACLAELRDDVVAFIDRRRS